MFVKRQRETENNTPNKPKTSDERISTYEELTIKVLNILESQGVNIYEEGRTGGMYLRNKDTEAVRVFKTIQQKETQKQEASEQLDDASIINFFKK